jgi:DNA-binding NtrC family response regulator
VDFSGKKILIVDDEKGFLDSLSKRIELMGFIPLKTTSGTEAVELCKTHHVDLAIVDFNMPEIDGLETVSKLRKAQPDIKTVLLTGYGNKKMRQAAEALHTAYFEKDNMRLFWSFIRKMSESDKAVFFPYAGQDESAQRDQRPDEPVVESNDAKDARPEKKSQGAKSNQDPFDLIVPENKFYNRDSHWLIGGTGSMEALKRKIASAAMIESHVLIIGEDGTGKEIVARAIHSLSQRKNKRFIGVNCGMMSPETLENELWGVEGRKPTRIGLVESCHEGSIFLDNIQDLSQSTQEKLARVLSLNLMTRKGGKEPVHADVRIMAACPATVIDDLNATTFQKEFYDQLAGFVITIPPLRERKDDIAPLCSYFMDKFGKEYEKPVKTISDEVIAAFSTYAFPGNVQELANLVERAVILLDGQTIELRHLPEKFRTPAKHSELFDDQPLMSLAEMEKIHIKKVMDALGNNRTRAAEVLGISRGALWRKLKLTDESE